MILHSSKEMDISFVSRSMKEHRLSPAPKPGFNAKPTYWQETQRWRRVVEEYEWGCVLFMDDRTVGKHSTVVVVGEINLGTGMVKSKGKMLPLPMAWYIEMVSELSPMADKASFSIPTCLGFHEPDQVCDGGLHPVLKKAEPPCTWRDRCMALQKHCLDSGRMQETVLNGHSPEQIVQLTNRLIDRAKKVEQPAVKPASAQQPTALASIVGSVVKEMASKCARLISLNPAKPKPGELFTVDRTENSDYISLYLAAKPKPKAIASFKLRPSIGGFRVQLPITKESPLLKDVKDVVAWKDGCFLSAINGVIPGQPKMEQVKTILLQLIQA